MPFVYEPITPADRERMELLNIMIGWKKPHAYDWAVDRDSGDFLVRIAPDREPPHWEWFAFWWNGRQFGVALDDIKTHPETGYCLDVVWVAALAEDGTLVSAQDSMSFGQALFEAVKAYATVDAARMMQNLRERNQLPPNVPLELQATLNDLSVSPFATFRIDFIRSAK